VVRKVQLGVAEPDRQSPGLAIANRFRRIEDRGMIVVDLRPNSDFSIIGGLRRRAFTNGHQPSA